MKTEQSDTATGNTHPPPSGTSAGFKASQGSASAAPGGLGSIPAQGLGQITFPPLTALPCFVCYDTPFLVANRRYKEGVYLHAVEQEKDSARSITQVLIHQWIF